MAFMFSSIHGRFVKLFILNTIVSTTHFGEELNYIRLAETGVSNKEFFKLNVKVKACEKIS